MVLRACDRCHSSKEKCVFTGDDQQQCTRCRRLKITCVTSRRNRRLGRRPAAKAFPHGQMQVWSVETQQPESPPRPQQTAQPPPPQDHEQAQRRLSQSSSPSPPQPQFQFQYQFGDPETTDTLDTSSAPSDRSESRSPSYTPSHASFTPSHTSYTPSHTSYTSEQIPTPECGDVVLLPPEKLLAAPARLRTMSDALRTVMDVEQFSVIHLPFMLGASFIPESQRTVYAILTLSGPTLTEGYLAFLGLMTAYQRSLVLRQDKPDMLKAAKGLQKLRSVTISHDYDAACALFLGQTMYVFNVLTADDSSTAHSIVRSSLMSTKQWIPRLIHFPVMDTIIMTPLLIDTVECLVRREVPIIRLPPTDRIIIDRYAGLCATLLRHLYDLCECSHALKRDVLDVEFDVHRELYERLAEIEQTIIHWEPPTSPQLFTEFGEHEILAMVTQANVYRLAALLIIHRLRYPLGVEDESAQQLANSIFAEMFHFAQTAAKKTTALPVVFPLTMAMIEIEGPGEELWDQLSSFTIQNMSAQRLQGFVRQVRAARDSGYAGLWFELAETKLHAAVPP